MVKCVKKTDILVVVGSCASERERYARRLAERTNRALVSARRLIDSPTPIEDALSVALQNNTSAGTIVEFPGEAVLTEIIAAMTEDDAAIRLIGVVCVADAAHLLDDLRRDSYLTHPTPPGHAPAAHRCTAHSLLSVTHLEYASTIILVNWQSMPTNELATIMALASSLSPHARLQLDHDERIETFHPLVSYTSSQERPGWIGVLNNEFDPYMTDPRVSAFRYENMRPFHPARLQHVLNDHIAQGHFGLLVRSSGFCRFATRANIVAQWEHVGRVISFHPMGTDDELGDDEELLAIGQDLAFVGLNLDHAKLSEALDAATLTDAELTRGPAAWARYPDPFPAWGAISRGAE